MRMIYNSKTLNPELLISEDFDVSDVGAKFWVINGDWEGIWLGDTFKCVREEYISGDLYSIYDFTTKPSLGYFSFFCCKENLLGVNYEAWFAHFTDLVEQGVIYDK